jgi:hypothetical protein
MVEFAPDHCGAHFRMGSCDGTRADELNGSPDFDGNDWQTGDGVLP